MDQHERRNLLCRLVEAMRNSGSWTGHTHIQKTALFLQELCGVRMDYEFVLYLHGPYSFDLSDDLALMRAQDQVGLEDREPYGPSFFVTNPNQDALADEDKLTKKIIFVADNIAIHGVGLLEQFATAFLLKSRGDWPDDDELAVELNRLKPHISLLEAHAAIKKVDEVRESAIKDGLCE